MKGYLLPIRISLGTYTYTDGDTYGDRYVYRKGDSFFAVDSKMIVRIHTKKIVYEIQVNKILEDG